MKRWLRLGILLGIAFLAHIACSPAPTTPNQTVSVVSPVAGRVTIDEMTKQLRPDDQTVFQAVGNPLYSLTFVTDTSRLSLVDIDANIIDLGGLFTVEDGIPGGLKGVTIRPQPMTPDDMILMVAGRRYSGKKQGSLWLFEVPGNLKANVIAFWNRLYGRPL